MGLDSSGIAGVVVCGLVFAALTILIIWGLTDGMAKDELRG